MAKKTVQEGSGGSGEVVACTFDDMRLKVGDRMLVQHYSSPSKERYAVTFIGYVPNGSVIVTSPQTDGLNLLMAEKDRMVVRVFTGHSAYAFLTTVLKVRYYPYNYMHLAFPDEVQKLLIRKAMRVQVHIIASVQNPARGGPMACLMLDLSATGALISTRQALGTAGETIYIRFRLKSSMIESDLTLQASIRSVIDKWDRSQESEEDAALGLKYRYGIEFYNLSVVDSATLKNGIFDLLM